MSGKREAVNRSADNTFIKININILNNDQHNTTQETKNRAIQPITPAIALKYLTSLPSTQLFLTLN